jgi:CHAT domain-containing protein
MTAFRPQKRWTTLWSPAAIPATFVVGTDGLIKARRVDPDYRKRMDTDNAGGAGWGAVSGWTGSEGWKMVGAIARAIVVVLFLALVGSARAGPDLASVEELVASALRAVEEGRVKDGIERLTGSFKHLDAAEDKTAHWRIGRTLVELLSQTENHTLATEVLRSLLSNKLPESDPYLRQWMQFYLGRNLALTGQPLEAQKFLRALTENDARLVITPAQRAGATMLSTIELDQNNVEQAAIWMRRALIGTFVDKGSGSQDIVDVLTSYAVFLHRTDRLQEAVDLFQKLAPIYDALFSPRGPRHLSFLGKFVNTLTATGKFQASDRLTRVLRQNADAVDIIPPTIERLLTYQEIYRLAREQSGNGRAVAIDRLKHESSAFPAFASTPRSRIFFCFLAAIAGDLSAAKEFLGNLSASYDLDVELSAYVTILQSYIAAGENRFSESIALARAGVDKARASHERFSSESPSRPPAISVEERSILGITLGLAAPHARSVGDADGLFHVAQFLNRDKAKLGLNSRAARQSLGSELQQENARTRDRLRDFRDKLVDEVTQTILAQALPYRAYAVAPIADAKFLLRLEELEDKIQNATSILDQSAPSYDRRTADSSVGLAAIQQELRPDEALMLHAVAGPSGLVTMCVTADAWKLHVKGWEDKNEIQQLIIDQKLVSAAVHGNHEPSPALDDRFPYESAHRLYKIFFGGIEPCLQGKKSILLATDPDLFATPWNALIVEALPEFGAVRHREAKWLPKAYSLSLLVSVRSLYQLRTKFSVSKAQHRFLGVGAPNLKGAVDASVPVTLGPLFAARGVANRTAISSLPQLPDAADELRSTAGALGEADSRLLLEHEATERELRKLPLDDYRVISFATHAVVAGEIEGITEPALVLSPGDGDDNPSNDGLLTMTEIANLKLDANLVILSACNTAASDGHVSGRGLSGFADAFFFAGARALAITQWAVFSESAKVLGSGLVSRSVQSLNIGVAEALRRTMVEYIANSKEDYLAHPRFWAAFVIAGDGAVRPLDGKGDGAVENDRPIRLDWSSISSDSRESEFLSVAKVSDSIVAMGILRPPAGEDRAGRYMAQIGLQQARPVPEVVSEPDIGVSAIVNVGGDIAVLGSRPSESKSSAVFRLETERKEIRWEVSIDSDLWNMPISVYETKRGYVLFSMENDYRPNGKPSVLILTEITKSGDIVRQHRHSVPVSAWRYSSKSIVEDSQGNFIVAIAGRHLSRTNSRWTNPRTGSTRFCVSHENTALFSFESETLALRSEKIIEGSSLVAMRTHAGRTYAVAGVAQRCSFDHHVRLLELLPAWEFRTIYEAQNINSLEAFSLEVTDDYFVMAGGMRTFLPTALTREIMTTEQLSDFQPKKWFDESYWEDLDDHSSAFLLVLGKDATVFADKVVPDLLHRQLSSIVATGENQFAGVGSAVGDRGWIVVFSLHRSSR